MSSTQSAAIKAGLRTAEQSLTMGLGVLTAGGAIAGATDWSSIDWKVLGSALAFLLLTAFFAGLKSYGSFMTNGIPAAYVDAGTASVTPAVITTVAPDPAPVGTLDLPTETPVPPAA